MYNPDNSRAASAFRENGRGFSCLPGKIIPSTRRSIVWTVPSASHNNSTKHNSVTRRLETFLGPGGDDLTSTVRF